MDETRSCARCVFVARSTNSRGKDLLHCKFNPPTLIAASGAPELKASGPDLRLRPSGTIQYNVVTVWPQVNPEMWCWKFEEDPDAPAPEPEDAGPRTVVN